jgi:glyoxalase/bleomycin resistance protein/dioxygenase superfamily protein
VLQDAKLTAFVAIRDEKQAMDFYSGILGLKKISADSFAVVFDSGGVKLRAALVKEVTEAKYTVLGWQVSGIEDVVRGLAAKGITFERYGFLKQDELGIWNAGTDKVAWFKDPFGNLLSVSEHVAKK